LTVSVTDANNHPVPSLFSVAVIDSVFLSQDENCLVPDFNDTRSISNVTLAATAGCTADDDMDLIMLLRKNTFGDKDVMIPTDHSDSLLYIKGKALEQKNRPAENIILTLFSNSGATSFFTDTTDSQGRFNFPVADYPYNTQFAIEAKNISGSNSRNITIIRDAQTFPRFSTPAYLKRYFFSEPLLTGKYRSAYLDTFISPIGSLPPVKVTAKKESTYNQSKRVSNYSTVIAGDDLDERQTVGNIVLKTGGLHMLNGYLVIGGLTSFKAPDAGSEPLLLIDGVEAPSVGSVGADVSPVIAALNSLSPKDIDFIEILKGADGANYGVRGGNGVILVNTSSSRRENFGPGNIQTFYAKGISRPADFPVIDYENKANKSSEQTDNRSTIFWKGNVLTGSADHVNLSFFTSDIPTTYKITISGVTAGGDIIYKTLSFQSK
jgi:hypothetical protein